MSYITFQDSVLHLVDYLGGGPSDLVQRDCRRAILEAYRELSNAHRWTYLYTHGRLLTSAPYNAGTIAFDLQGGLYDRMVTLTGGVWPDWAAFGSLRMGTVAYRVAERKSDTVLTLVETQSPYADLPPGTTYHLFQDVHLLPLDFIAQDQLLYENNFGGMTYVHPRDWLYRERYTYSENTPRVYTVVGDPAIPGRLTLRLAPAPMVSKTLDYLYQRRPRPLQLVEAGVGLAAIPAAGTQVTASVATFTPQMVGAVLRLSGSSAPPTSAAGGALGFNPAAYESVITAYVSGTVVACTDPANNALSGVACTISDPVDIELESMANAYYRCIEKHIAQNRTLKDKPSAAAQYRMALEEARAADSRSFARRVAGPQEHRRYRLRDMPVGPDES